jgi:hypothetical protein
LIIQKRFASLLQSCIQKVKRFTSLHFTMTNGWNDVTANNEERVTSSRPSSSGNPPDHDDESPNDSTSNGANDPAGHNGAVGSDSLLRGDDDPLSPPPMRLCDLLADVVGIRSTTGNNFVDGRRSSSNRHPLGENSLLAIVQAALAIAQEDEEEDVRGNRQDITTNIHHQDHATSNSQPSQ